MTRPLTARSGRMLLLAAIPDAMMETLTFSTQKIPDAAISMPAAATME